MCFVLFLEASSGCCGRETSKGASGEWGPTQGRGEVGGVDEAGRILGGGAGDRNPGDTPLWPGHGGDTEERGWRLVGRRTGGTASSQDASSAQLGAGAEPRRGPGRWGGSEVSAHGLYSSAGAAELSVQRGVGAWSGGPTLPRLTTSAVCPDRELPGGTGGGGWLGDAEARAAGAGVGGLSWCVPALHLPCWGLCVPGKRSATEPHAPSTPSPESRETRPGGGRWVPVSLIVGFLPGWPWASHGGTLSLSFRI